MDVVKYLNKDFVLMIFKGMLVGTGAILPGVSGGVLCVAFGIYEPLIEILSDPKENIKKHANIFLPFGIGWLAGFFLLAKLLEVLFTKYETFSTVFFAGLIIGTIPSILKEAKFQKKDSFILLLWIILFTLLFLFLDNSKSFSIQGNFLWYLASGFIWGLSMIIPGLSSSSLLIVMGLYQKITSGIANFDLSVILPLLVGLLVAVFSLSKLIKHLYKQYRSFICLFITGIMIASVLCMLAKLTYHPNYILAYLFLFILAYFIATKFDK